MEEGSLRADVNVSVRKHGEPYRTRCEVKNLNSVRFVMQAIEAEATRQVAVWEAGGHGGTGNPPVRFRARTDAQHAHRKRTRTTTATSPTPTCCRSCSTPPGWRSCDRTLPELPDDKRARFIRDYGLSAYDAGSAGGRTGDRGLLRGRWREGRDAKQAANWITGDLFATLHRNGRTIETCPGERGSAGHAARPAGR